MATELPAGWTETTIKKYELRRGDPTTLIIFNIGANGIGSAANMRDWLIAGGYRINKEWWEQNEFYVIRIWGTISPTWFVQRWGPPSVTYYIPPPPAPGQPAQPPQTTPPPAPTPAPSPIPSQPPSGTICPSPNRSSKRTVGISL